MVIMLKHLIFYHLIKLDLKLQLFKIILLLLTKIAARNLPELVNLDTFFRYMRQVERLEPAK